MKNLKLEKLWLELIEPFRDLEFFNQIEDRDLQTISILLHIQQVPFLVEAINKKAAA